MSGRACPVPDTLAHRCRRGERNGVVLRRMCPARRPLSLLLAFVSATAAGIALAHRIPGVSRMNPGDGFTVASFRGLERDPQTKRYGRSPIMLENMRDSAW